MSVTQAVSSRTLGNVRDIDTLEATADYLGLTPKSLRQRRYRGEAPPAIKLDSGSRGTVRFRKTDVDRWLDERLDRGGGPDAAA